MSALSEYPGKVLIEYKRKSRRRPYGVVVAIDRNIIGWSICHKNDTFTKEDALRIALERAQAAQLLSIEDREKSYEEFPTSLLSIYQKMKERSAQYFKVDA